MKIRDWFNTEWITKATLAGLKAAIEDMEYSWGIPEPAYEQASTRNEKDYPVKLAA